jgi:hypothetical protein
MDWCWLDWAWLDTPASCWLILRDGTAGVTRFEALRENLGIAAGTD